MNDDLDGHRFDYPKFNDDNKFDVQNGRSRMSEDIFAERFQLKKFELKTETFQWARTGNVFVEFRNSGRPSGLAVTQADFQTHELLNVDGQTLVYLMTPTDVLRKICRAEYRAGKIARGAGDGGRSEGIILGLHRFVDHLIRMGKA